MSAKKNPLCDKAHEMYKQGMKLVDIADALEVPPGTVRRWKSTHGKRFRWRMERRHARRSLLKFLFLFLALCVVLDVWGPGQIALMALLGLFVLWLLARYLRDDLDAYPPFLWK